MQIYNFACCFVCMSNLVSDIQRQMQAGCVWEQCGKEDIGPTRDKVTVEWKMLNNEEFHNLYYLLVCHIDDDMHKACGTYKGEGKVILGFEGETWRKGTTWKT